MDQWAIQVNAFDLTVGVELDFIIILDREKAASAEAIL